MLQIFQGAKMLLFSYSLAFLYMEHRSFGGGLLEGLTSAFGGAIFQGIIPPKPLDNE